MNYRKPILESQHIFRIKKGRILLSQVMLTRTLEKKDEKEEGRADRECGLGSADCGVRIADAMVQGSPPKADAPSAQRFNPRVRGERSADWE